MISPATITRHGAPREASPAASSLAGLQGAANGRTDPAGFASLLQQNRNPPPAPQPAPPPPSAVKPAAAPAPTTARSRLDEAADNAPAATTAASEPTTETAGPLPTAPGTGPTVTDGRIARDRLRASEGVARPEHRAAKGEVATEASTEATGRNDDPVSKDEPSAWLPVAGSVQPQPVGTTRIALRDLASSDPAGASDRDITTAARGNAVPPGTDPADPKLGAEGRPGAAHLPGPAADAAATNPFADLLADQRRAEPTVGSRPGGGVLAGDAVAAGAALGPASASTQADHGAAPAGVAITTSVDAPDFAQQLGLSLAVLTRDGVKHAELTLNPPDLGPVSVQIAVDGTQARVDFGADLAATRRVIEAGLPELAGALRDAGFTLAGGGVSDHAGSRGGRAPNGDGAAGGPRSFERVADEGVTRLAVAARQAVGRGGVDLFA